MNINYFFEFHEFQASTHCPGFARCLSPLVQDDQSHLQRERDATLQRLTYADHAVARRFLEFLGWGWAGLAWLGWLWFGLGFGWLLLGFRLGFRLDLGLILGWIRIWLGWIRLDLDFAWILVGFRLDFDWIWLHLAWILCHYSSNSSHSSLGSPRKP